MKLSHCECLKQQAQHTYHQHPDQANDPVLQLLTWANHGTSSTASRTSLINQTLQQQKTKPFICHSLKYVLSKINVTKMNNMGNDIFTSKMQRNKLFFLMHEVQLFGTKFIFIAAFLQTVSLHRDQMLFVTYFNCDIFFTNTFGAKS